MDVQLNQINRNKQTDKGISDSFYFSRLFHKIMGMSPTDYRKKLKTRFSKKEPINHPLSLRSVY